MIAVTPVLGLVILLAAIPSASAAEARFGTLPAGAISVSEISDVSAEICRDHLFDPSAVAGRLPPGFRLVTVAETAPEDPAVAAFVKANPQYAHYAVGSLCFMSVGKF